MPASLSAPRHGTRHGASPGFLLMEALIGTALILLFFLAVGLVLINGQEQTIAGGDRTRATYFAERTVEGTRAIRDASFSSLAAGTRGVSLNGAGQWAFSSAYAVATGGYITSVSISSMASDWMRVSAQAKWRHGYARSGSVILQTDLTNWRAAGSVGNWGTLSLQASVTESPSPHFTSITGMGNYVFVTGTIADGGAGLYVYDVSSLASPARLVSMLSLPADALAAVVRGKMLYVLTTQGNGEIRAYSLSSMPDISYAFTYDLPGSGLATSIGAYGYMLYVTSTYSAVSGEKEFYALDASSTGSLTLKSSYDDSGTHRAVAVSGTSAYLGSALDAYDLSVLNVANSGSLTAASGIGYNVSGSEDGYAVAISGTSALLGRQRGTGIQEFVMFKIPNGGVPSTPGPYYRETSGSILSIATDPGKCYAFVATQQAWKALQVINIGSTSLPEKSFYTLSTGKSGKAVHYDMVRDVLYFADDTTLYIFRPGASTGSC